MNAVSSATSRVSSFNTRTGAVTLVTAVHTVPSATGYTEIKEFGPNVSLSPTLVPAFVISLATVDLD